MITREPSNENGTSCNACAARDYGTATRPPTVPTGTVHTFRIGTDGGFTRIALCAKCRAELRAILAD